MGLATKRFEGSRVRVAFGWLQEHSPNTAQPAAVAFDASAAPRSAHFPAAKEDEISTDGIRAISPHQVIRGDDITTALAHFLAVFAQHHSLVAQLQHRFVPARNSAIAGGFVEEAGVDEVHGGMFGTAGVCIHGHPIVVLLRVKRTLVVIGAEVTQVIPRGAHEGVHGVGLALSRTATRRTGGKAPGGVEFERALAGGEPLHVIREQDGQLVFRDGDGATTRAVNYRDGRAPVALAGNQPVVEAIIGGGFAEAVFLNVANGGGHGVRFWCAGERA